MQLIIFLVDSNPGAWTQPIPDGNLSRDSQAAILLNLRPTLRKKPRHHESCLVRFRSIALSKLNDRRRDS
jgi:hypothetical protein